MLVIECYLREMQEKLSYSVFWLTPIKIGIGVDIVISNKTMTDADRRQHAKDDVDLESEETTSHLKKRILVQNRGGGKI